MLIPPSDLGVFNKMVTPFEVEAYDILKYRSRAYDKFCNSKPCENHFQRIFVPHSLNGEFVAAAFTHNSDHMFKDDKKLSYFIYVKDSFLFFT